MVVIEGGFLVAGSDRLRERQRDPIFRQICAAVVLKCHPRCQGSESVFRTEQLRLVGGG